MGQTSSQPPPPSQASQGPPSARCPIQHDSPSTQHDSASPVSSSSTSQPSQCPVPHNNTSADSPHAPIDPGSLNPLNHIPLHLSHAPAHHQSVALPTDREASTIPRPASPDGSGSGVWEYPSPQQFYNALVRKGWETPEEHIETMVQIHNFLNERAWDEVVKWEKRVDPSSTIELVRFRGRPGELSPKARFWLFAGWLLPSRFNTEPPFDRHDWIVRRPTTGEEVRYVIDYYSAPPEPDGSPVFSLDVRPALDSAGSIKERLFAATEETWTSFREEPGKASW